MLNKKLRRGWTTGACAVAASKAAYIGLLTGNCPNEITIHLPKGQTPTFNIAYQDIDQQSVSAGVIKDAGDDPDVTDGILIISRIERSNENNGIKFIAGEGVGTVTLSGLPLNIGEPAINPGPRKMITKNIKEIANSYRDIPNINLTIEVPEGRKIARKTWNPRLGIINGISILGTTGIVIPYSCSAWIHSIHRGIDVARHTKLEHIAGCTGSVSEKITRIHYSLPEQAMIDMGDFAGGLLKYLRRNTVPRLTISGGFAKLVKLSQGSMDLHSSRSQVDIKNLQKKISLINSKIETENILTANQALEMMGSEKYQLAESIANHAQNNVCKMLANSNIGVDIMIIDRKEEILTKTHIKYA